MAITKSRQSERQRVDKGKMKKYSTKQDRQHDIVPCCVCMCIFPQSLSI